MNTGKHSASLDTPCEPSFHKNKFKIMSLLIFSYRPRALCWEDSEASLRSAVENSGSDWPSMPQTWGGATSCATDSLFSLDPLLETNVKLVLPPRM